MISTLRRTLASTLVVAALLAAATPGPAEAGLGSGDPSLSVSATSVPSERATDITVRGTDFLVPPHDCPTANVFGGVYVLFGWVESGSAWGPSARNSSDNAGAFGHTYAYPGDGGDANIRDDGTGRIRLVSFTGGGESGSATDFHMDCNGNWETSMTIHSPVFQYTMPGTGEARTIDCRALTSGRCGILTIGAHGKASATNETFVPVNFTEAGPGSPADPQVPTGPSTPGDRPAATGQVEAAPGEVVEEIVEVPSPFAETSGSEATGGFPGLDQATNVSSSGAAVGVPGADGAPVVVAAAGSPALSVEATEISDTGRVPRWFVPGLILLIAAAGGVTYWQRRRTDAAAEALP